MSCSRCGFESPAGFRFCGSCGAPLSSSDGPATAAERKVVSALFCDIVGSTERAERVDPEDVRDALAPFYAVVRDQLQRFGGTVEKFIGDAVCGLFGAPRAHGDDPERAVRAALAIRDWLSDLHDAGSSLDLHLRLGVATGEAVVAVGARSMAGEAMAWGDVMNTAARLQTAAHVDGILVDERTYRATRHAIDFAEAQPVKVKGKKEPVLVWQALTSRARRGVDLSQQGDEPFVGRDREFSFLRRALTRVEERRDPHLVVLVGEPGVGKSRLAFELFRWIEQQPELVGWRQVSSSPYGDVLTYWALGEIVKAQAGILETDSAAAAGKKLTRAVTDVVPDPAEATRVETHLRSLVGLGEAGEIYGDQRGEAFVAWRRFLEAVAERRTLVLVFEDVHWADAGLLDFIEHLLDSSRGVRILVLCTARPEFSELRPNWWGRQKTTMTPVSPLSNDEIRELVEGFAPHGIRDETREAIVTSACGNPLFAVEFIRMLLDRSELPPSVESVKGIIEARLDALPVDDKLLLQNAAVVGRAVWPGVLSQIGDRPRRVVHRQLRELVRREFLTRLTPSSVAGETEFGFRHALVQDVAYEQIPRVRKAEIHRRTAQWLESLSPDRAADRAEMLAHHYRTAFEIASEANADTSELAESARISLRDAGDRALSLNAFAVAARHYREALELWPESDPEQPALLLRLGRANYYDADAEGTDAIVAEAEERLSELGDRASAAEAAVLRANLAHTLRTPQETVFEHAFRALRLIDGLEASRSKIEVLLEVAVLLTLAADQDRAIALAQEARSDAEELGIADLEARALAAIGTARGLSGDPDARADLRRSIEIIEEIDSPLASHLCGILADLECSLGHLDDCFTLQARARRHAERFGHAAHIQWLKAERVAECYWRGAWEEAMTLADEFLAECESGVGHFMEPYCHAVRARILLARGNITGALDDALQSVEKARLSEEPQMLCPALAVHARALIAAGTSDEAGRVVDELLSLWGAKLNLFLASAWVVDLAWALEGLGRERELSEIADGVHARTAWLEAALACASARFDVAAEQLARIGSAPDAALARLRFAQMHSVSGLDSRLHGDLELALAFFGEVQAGVYLREAEAVVPVA